MRHLLTTLSFHVGLGLSSLLAVNACSGSDSSNGSTGGAPGTGGTASLAGGTSALGTTGTGDTPSAGGASASTIQPSTGGTSAGNGGTTSGGTSAATGGTKATGGTSSATGGTKATGGTSSASGGTKATGGTSSTGGTTGVTTNAACPGADATEFALVKAWLNNTTAMDALPSYAYANIKTNFPAGAAFDTLACSIAASCAAFAPKEAVWLRKCEAVITSAIVAESSYNPASVVLDTYGQRVEGGVTANDPTVGLLQDRFSSTVRDYNYYGPMAKMATIGCNWPSELLTWASSDTRWLTTGGTTYLSFLKDPACNIALGTWYYFINATGNGGSTAVWTSAYCAGNGIAGNMLVGLMSHLQGGSFTRPADGTHEYPWGIECCTCGNPGTSYQACRTACTNAGCTGRVAAFLAIGTSNARPAPDPFTEVLVPEPEKYCK